MAAALMSRPESGLADWPIDDRCPAAATRDIALPPCFGRLPSGWGRFGRPTASRARLAESPSTASTTAIPKYCHSSSASHCLAARASYAPSHSSKRIRLFALIPLIPDEDPELSFVDWNTLLLDHFFGTGCQGGTVLISVGADEIDAIGPHLGGYAGLLDAVNKGPPFLPRYDDHGNPIHILNRFRTFGARTLVYWRTHAEARPAAYVEPATKVEWGPENGCFPAYLPIVAALVALYCEHPGEGGYYLNTRNRFRLIDLNPAWGEADLTAIREAMFNDLTHWSIQENNGAFGRFEPRPLGNYVHLAWLRGQSILRRSDEQRLRNLFYELNLTPDDELPTAQRESLLREIQAAAPPFSVGLQLASGDVYYRGILFSRLDTLREEWDGSGPAAHDGGPAQENAPLEPAESSLALFYRNEEPNWRLGLLLPEDAVLTADEAAETIRIPRLRWAGRQTEEADSSGLLITPLPDVLGGLGSLETLRQLPGKTIAIEGCRHGACLRHRDVRYFVPDRGRLVERDGLPDHDGHAYVLAAPDAVGAIEQALDADGATRLVALLPQLQVGLPTAEWRLYHVPNSHVLRTLDIPFPGDDAHRKPFRPITLTGGSTAQRGGRRWYLPYDLPYLQVDHPGPIALGGVTEGLEAIESPIPAEAPDGGLGVGATHRFSLRSTASGTYRLVATADNNHVIGEVLLRIAPWDIEPGEGHTVGLLDDGRVSTTGTRVSGFTIVTDDIRPDADFAEVLATDNVETIGVNANYATVITDQQNFLQTVHANPVLQFLDWLAHRNSAFVPLGLARSQLLNLQPDLGIRTSVLFRALRRRGLLEIVTDTHGRWSGIARLPCVTTPTYLTSNGLRLASASGTLSFNSWQSLLESDGPIHSCEPHDDLGVPTLLLPCQPDTPAMSPVTPAQLVDLSASLDQLEQQWKNIGYEGSPHAHDEWLFVVNATWKPYSDMLAPYMGPFIAPWTLWRSNDPWRQGATLRTLRQRHAGTYRSRPITDERWATWLTLKSFAGLPRFGLHQPWPLHFSHPTSAMWVPARLNLPLVLERALIACSGVPPRELRLVSFENNGGVYGHDTGGDTYGPFHSHYHHYLGRANDARTWLEYRHVPHEIARSVAAKLSCRLVEF
jgi:hypothetical protein